MKDVTRFPATGLQTIRQYQAYEMLRRYLLHCCERPDSSFDSTIERKTGVLIYAMKKRGSMHRIVDFEYDSRFIPLAANW